MQAKSFISGLRTEMAYPFPCRSKPTIKDQGTRGENAATHELRTSIGPRSDLANLDVGVARGFRRFPHRFCAVAHDTDDRTFVTSANTLPRSTSLNTSCLRPTRS